MPSMSLMLTLGRRFLQHPSSINLNETEKSLLNQLSSQDFDLWTARIQPLLLRSSMRSSMGSVSSVKNDTWETKVLYRKLYSKRHQHVFQ